MSGRLEPDRRRRRRWRNTLTPFEMVAAAAIVLGMGGWLLVGRFTPALGARTIWIDGSGRPPEQPISFFAVRDFQLPTTPSAARLLIRSDTEYRVFLNRTLVGSGRGSRGDLLDSYDVGNLLRARGNRLVAELRSVDGEGGLLCHLHASREGRWTRSLVSDASWRTVERYQAGMLGSAIRLTRSRPAVVLPSRRAWRLTRPGPQLPRIADLLSDPSAKPPRRFQTGPPSDSWQQFDPEAGSKGTRVTFDWGRPVDAFLTLMFRESPEALVYFGTEPPDPRRDRAQALVQGFSGSGTWADTRPRRFRYVMVVGRVRVAGARADTLRPEWAEAMLGDGAAAPTEAPEAVTLEDAWRRLTGGAQGRSG